MDTQSARILRAVEAASLASAAVFCFVLMLYVVDPEMIWGLGHFGFLAWTLSPYAVFFALSRWWGKHTPLAPLAGCFASVLMLAASVYVYVDSMFVHTSSTSALVFLFFPFYLMVGGPLLFALGMVLGLLPIVWAKFRGTPESGPVP